MRALTISAHGGTDRLEYRTDITEPETTPGTVRVRLRAASLNRLDVFTLGGLPGVTIQPPWVMGADGAGTIDAVPRPWPAANVRACSEFRMAVV